MAELDISHLLNSISYDNQILSLTSSLGDKSTADIQVWFNDLLEIKQIISDVKEDGIYSHSFVKYPDQSDCIGPIFKHGF